MEFCSSHVYFYSDSEDETISNDESAHSDCEQLSYERESLSNSSNKSLSTITTDNHLNVTSENSLDCINDINNNTSIRTSSIKVNETSNFSESQFRFCVPNSISTIKRENSILSNSSDQNLNGLFYYSSDSVESSKHNKSINDVSSNDSFAQIDGSISNWNNNEVRSMLFNPIENLYQQTSMSHVNSVVNYVSINTTKLNKTYVKVRKPDTNIVSIRLSEIVDASSNMHTGDVIFCETCNAIISNKSILSNLKHKGQIMNGKLWDCEYCSTKNLIEIDINEMPTEDDVTYLVESPKDIPIDDDSIIVFCIDISGSMNVTEKIDGLVCMKSFESKMKRFELETGEKYITNENETYISRLDSLQLAVEQNLEILRLKYPNKRVFLIAFNDNLLILGDGLSAPLTISHDKLQNENEILEITKKIQFIRPIRDTKEKILNRLYQLEACGSTALGPALMLSINVAGKKAGSQVILCTDGLANNGFGNLEGSLEDSILVYENLTNLAIKLGVSVSIITLKGTGCKLSIIGRLAEYTNGKITSVDQSRVKEEIEMIIENDKILASNVKATIITHKSIYIENEESSAKVNRIVRELGNIRAGNEITFQYGILCSENEINELNKISMIPFQLQLSYEAKNGSKVIRVITQQRPYTKDRKTAEKNSSLKMVARHALSTQAKQIAVKSFSQKQFSSVPIRSKLKCVKQYLKERQYNNDFIKESFNSLMTVAQSKSLKSSSYKNSFKMNTNESTVIYSDEESEMILQFSQLNSLKF